MWLLMRHYLLIEAVMKESRNQKWNVHGDWCDSFGAMDRMVLRDLFRVLHVFLTYDAFFFRKRRTHVSVIHIYSRMPNDASERGAHKSVCCMFSQVWCMLFQKEVPTRQCVSYFYYLWCMFSRQITIILLYSQFLHVRAPNPCSRAAAT